MTIQKVVENFSSNPRVNLFQVPSTYFLNETKTAGHTVKQILRDSGKEFDNHSVKNILNDRSIDLRLTMVETPEQNGLLKKRSASLWKLQEL